MSDTFDQVWARVIRSDAEAVERVGDRIGSNNVDLANRAYALAGDLRAWATGIENRGATE